MRVLLVALAAGAIATAPAAALDRSQKTPKVQSATPAPPAPRDLRPGVPEGRITVRGRPVTARFFVDETHQAWLELDNGTAATPQQLPILDPQSALLLLSDERFAFLAPALRQWAGPGLTGVRDRAIERARVTLDKRLFPAEAATPAQQFVRPRVRAVLQYADALAAGGQRVAAADLLERERSAITLAEKDWSVSEWTMMSLRHAVYLRDTDTSADELVALAAGSARLGSNAYHLNFDINRAARLAETGRYAEALAIIEPAETAFRGTSDRRLPDGGEKIDGALREFAWIHACALHGLGRDAQAAPILARLADDSVRAFPDSFAPPAANLQLRIALCLRDPDRIAGVLAREFALDPLVPGMLLWLQPGLRPENVPDPLIADVRAKLLARPAIAARFHLLGPDMADALARWRGPDGR